MYQTLHDAQFSVLAAARPLFRLSVLEAIYSNSLQPTFCRRPSKRIRLFTLNFTPIFCAHFGLKPNNNFLTNQPVKMTNFDQLKYIEEFCIFLY